MTNLNIIPLSERPDLVETCAAWSYSEWGCYIADYDLNTAINNYKKRAQNNTGLDQTWISFQGKKMTGMASLKKDDHPDIKDLTPWLASVFIHRRFRKQGHASALIERLHAEAKALNFEKLYLFTPDAEGLYTKHGYKKIGDVRDTTGIRKDETLMEKTL